MIYRGMTKTRSLTRTIRGSKARVPVCARTGRTHEPACYGGIGDRGARGLLERRARGRAIHRDRHRERERDGPGAADVLGRRARAARGPALPGIQLRAGPHGRPPVLHLREAGAVVPRSMSALWALGFRPFYLLAGIFAALSVPLWAARFAGWLAESVWHAHEIIFGYAFAVMVGFLFTAVRNWTGRPTPTGGTLAAIALAWVAARVLVFTPWTELAAFADAAFALAAAAGIAVPLIASGNRRNLFFVVLLVALGALNLCFYLAKDDVLD